jgi:hypothetical protein
MEPTMDVKQLSKLIKVLRQDILRAFKQWVDSVPDPDKPFIGTASGELFSPRQVVEHVERQTPEGDEFVQDWIRVAINKATLEMLQPQPVVRATLAAPGAGAPDLEREGDQLDVSLAELDLSVRAANSLESEGITTLRDLVNRTDEELLNVRNFGETTLREVKRKLSQRGLRLGMSTTSLGARQE